MNAQQFRAAVLDVSLKAIDKSPDEWVTFNDALHTRVIEDIYIPDKVTLVVDELPILECDLVDNYLLITTERIICVSNDAYEEVYIDKIEKIVNDYEALNYTKINGQYPETNKVALLKRDGSKLTFLIDSYYPAFFSKILIQNILSYKVKGDWYLNPSNR